MEGNRSLAIVLGASISGLLDARVLSRHFDRVLLVERDVLADCAEVRKGAAQAAHAHGLLASGYRLLDEYFPGLLDELRALGAPGGDVTGDFLWFQYGHWKLRHESGLRGITVSRPCLEAAVRRHVRALANVAFLENVDGVRPAFDAGRGRVTGLVVRRRDRDVEETLDADLVVDATGRGSQSARWLDEWGFGRPEEIDVKVDVGYATRVFERRTGEFFNSNGGIVAATPPSARYGAVLAAEGNRWVVTLVGSLGDHPPLDESGWARFAGSLPVPAVIELVTAARPLTPITSYRFPANRRRLYERMRRFPEGYLVTGDAICSFNPVYGQGMSVAALEARALDESVEHDRDHLAVRFFARARRIVDTPWTIATGEDLRLPDVEGRRPPGAGLLNRYFDRVHAAASDDPVVCRKFFDVLNLLAAPPSLLSPSVAWRVLARTKPRGAGSPWGAASGREPASVGR